MKADAPRLREVRTITTPESTLGTLSGPDGRTIEILPGDSGPRFRLLDESGRENITVEDPSIPETEHRIPDPGRLHADVPIRSIED